MCIVYCVYNERYYDMTLTILYIIYILLQFYFRFFGKFCFYLKAQVKIKNVLPL